MGCRRACASMRTVLSTRHVMRPRLIRPLGGGFGLAWSAEADSDLIAKLTLDGVLMCVLRGSHRRVIPTQDVVESLVLSTEVFVVGRRVGHRFVRARMVSG